MFFGGLGFIALIILLVWLASGGKLQPQGTRPEERDRSLEIARERYARGEISKEEFERLERDLRGAA
ncbi:MAG: hypothetical protein C4521_01130 [Actinobacteria bacterium]|nr:MAG: hypothetical protein C4521_01130 [Actinomycetota bacterium]